MCNALDTWRKLLLSIVLPCSISKQAIMWTGAYKPVVVTAAEGDTLRSSGQQDKMSQSAEQNNLPTTVIWRYLSFYTMEEDITILLNQYLVTYFYKKKTMNIILLTILKWYIGYIPSFTYASFDLKITLRKH
jgi:hypothetical protein